MTTATYKSFKDLSIRKNFKSTSLDSLANSSNPSDCQSDDSHDSDSDSKSKSSFAVQCEVYAENNSFASIRSWTKSDSSEASIEYDEKKPADKRMETIPEECAEPKVSVKEILARFENLKKGKREKAQDDAAANAKESTQSSQQHPAETLLCVPNVILDNFKSCSDEFTNNNSVNSKKSVGALSGQIKYDEEKQDKCVDKPKEKEKDKRDLNNNSHSHSHNHFRNGSHASRTSDSSKSSVGSNQGMQMKEITKVLEEPAVLKPQCVELIKKAKDKVSKEFNNNVDEVRVTVDNCMLQLTHYNRYDICADSNKKRCRLF